MGLGPIAGEGDIKMHCCVAAYISDYAFLGTALLPHRWQCNVHFMASLDHSMWFHAPFRADRWMLYQCESPWAGKCGAMWDKGIGLGVAGSLLFYRAPIQVTCSPVPLGFGILVFEMTG